jgi:hypothetical protein
MSRPFISAKYLLAAPPPAETVIPKDFPIERYAARVAAGARRAKGGAIVGSTSPRDMAMTRSNRNVAAWAARGW